MVVTNDQFVIKTDFMSYEGQSIDNWTVTITDILSGRYISVHDILEFDRLINGLNEVYHKIKNEKSLTR